MASSSPDAAIAARRLALLAALVEGDTRTAYGLARESLEAGMPFDAVVEELLAPVVNELGARWARDELTVADEHAASVVAGEVVTLLAGALEPGDGPSVLVACPDGEQHALGAHVVAAHLRLEGVQAMFLGGSLPATDLADYLTHHEIDAVVLSVSMPASLPAAADAIAATHAHGVPVLVGGRAFDAHGVRAGRLGADAQTATLAEVSDAVARLAGTAPHLAHPVAADPDLAAERALLQTRRHALVDEALRDAPGGPETVAGSGPELVWLLEVLDAALLLDDPTVVAEQVAWMRARADALGGPAGVAGLDRRLTALRRALGPDLGRSTDTLDAASAGHD